MGYFVLYDPGLTNNLFTDPMPSMTEIEKKVRDDIHLFSGFPQNKIKTEMVIAKPPLSLVDPAWNSLTLSLRAYIQFHNGDNTILLSEVKKKDQTVQGIIDIVTTRTPR
jgi:hypothetical protein